MLIFDYMRWWYGRGWAELGLFFVHRIQKTSLDFSVVILLNTLLKPWRQTIETGQRNIAERLKSMLGNMVSRGVGATVRLAALITACLLILGESALAVIFIVAWPLLPFGGVGLLIWGLLCT